MQRQLLLCDMCIPSKRNTIYQGSFTSLVWCGGGNALVTWRCGPMLEIVTMDPECIRWGLTLKLLLLNSIWQISGYASFRSSEVPSRAWREGETNGNFQQLGRDLSRPQSLESNHCAPSAFLVQEPHVRCLLGNQYSWGIGKMGIIIPPSSWLLWRLNCESNKCSIFRTLCDIKHSKLLCT